MSSLEALGSCHGASQVPIISFAGGLLGEMFSNIWSLILVLNRELLVSWYFLGNKSAFCSNEVTLYTYSIHLKY